MVEFSKHQFCLFFLTIKIKSVVRSLNAKPFQSLTSVIILSVFPAWLIASTQLDWCSHAHTSLICVLFNYIISITTMAGFGNIQLIAPLFPLVNLNSWECCLSNIEVMQKGVWEVSMSNKEGRETTCSASIWESPEWFQLQVCRLTCLWMASLSIQQLCWLYLGNSSLFWA